MAEKMRVHILAKELNVPSKDIITKCQAEGLVVTNHMSTLSAGLEATIREWFSEGMHSTTIETADPVDMEKVRKAAQRRAIAESASSSSGTAVAEMETATLDSIAEAVPNYEIDIPTHTLAPVETEALPAQSIVEPPSPQVAPSPEEAGRGLTIEAPDSQVDSPTADDVDLAQGESTDAPPAPAVEIAPPPPPEKIMPAGPQNVPAPVKLKGPRVVRYEPIDESVPTGPPRRRLVAGVGDAARGPAAPGAADAAGRRRARVRGVVTTDAARKGRTGKRGDEPETDKFKEWRDRDLAERQERISDATGRRIHTRRAVETTRRGPLGSPAQPKTEASVQEPISMKDLCAATGISLVQMLPILKREFGVVGNINMELTPEMSEYIALENGVTLTVLPAKTALDDIQDEFASREPKLLKPRPPVVTILGHVDHGKTSLLDAIRSTHVARKEDGGITQHIGAYHLQHKKAGGVTFVDTPGHAAFTAMRARGAKITDIVVLVVAADDGIMPQTVEAINHAKAAGVPVVVALNKIDLGTQNIHRIYGQLAEQGYQPSGDWGGDTDVIHTSASTGQGIDELVEHLAAFGEILGLKADYKGDAMGTVIEAETKEGVGAVVRVLVQRGLLRTGDMVVCGNAFGKVRALLDDRGKRLKEAGPSIPVEIWGLDEVPMAGDNFYVVDSMQRAKLIADDAKRRRLREGRAASQRVRSLEEMVKRRDSDDVPELNIIIKADVDGSLDALREMLSKIPSDEVKLGIRHTGVGTVNDSDILLADASSAIVVAFRVLPSSGAKKLAEEKGVDVRQYKVIYEVADDIKKALEGLLAPDETIETRATCVVREVFNITKVGNIAGCMVTDGVVMRNNLLRLVRDGVLVRDKCRIASLRRFKDDAKEVRAGMECGIRLEGFNDLKPGDVLEAFEVVKRARTL